MPSFARASARCLDWSSDLLNKQNFAFLFHLMALALAIHCLSICTLPCILRLVGIELNPGPSKGSKTKQKGGNKKKSKKSGGGSQAGVSYSNTSGPSNSGSFGSKLGGFLGDAAQRMLSHITGFGDYTVSQNSLYSGSVDSSGPPAFAGGRGQTRIVHREYIGDVLSVGSAFSINYYLDINPSNQLAFPWLSTIANNYETFKFHGLIFEYKTTSATAVASTNTALGVVVMATQYNIDDPVFTSKVQMEQFQFAVSTVPSNSMIHPVECKPQSGVTENLYVYTGGTGDLRFTQAGVFTLATAGQQAAANIGELWVSYDICLSMPRQSNVSAGFYYRWGVANASGTGGTSVDPFYTNTSTVPLLATGNNIVASVGTNGGSAGGNAGKIFIAPDEVGTYVLTIVIVGASNATIAYSSTTLNGGLVAASLMQSNASLDSGSFIVAPSQGASSNTMEWNISFTVPSGLAPSAVPYVFLNNAGSTLPATITTLQLTLQQVSYSN